MEKPTQGSGKNVQQGWENQANKQHPGQPGQDQRRSAENDRKNPARKEDTNNPGNKTQKKSSQFEYEE